MSFEIITNEATAKVVILYISILQLYGTVLLLTICKLLYQNIYKIQK